MMIKAIVLDLGGVLLRTEDQTSRRELEKRYNLSPGKIHDLVFNSPLAISATLGEVDTKAVWEYVADELNLSPKSLESFQQAFWAGDQLDLDLLTFVQSCHQDYITAILSNAWGDARKTLAERFGIIQGKTVDYILISAELGVAKPDPKIYHILSESLNCKFQEILFIDDFYENIIAASRLGIQTIHYQPDLNIVEKIKRYLADLSAMKAETRCN